MSISASTRVPSARADPGLERALTVSGGFPRWGGLAVFVAVFAYSWFGDHRGHVYDDAGITLRYAERIAAGKGFGYNDGEAVNGASNPLFVLAEAALLRLGLTPELTIRWIASACLATIAGVLFSTFARFYSLGAACFSLLALLAFRLPFEAMTDGMETPIVMLLAALLFRALHGDGFLFPGLVLGLLVANKLDGGLAAMAYAAVYVVARRRFPWRAAGIALLAAAPIFVVLLVSFGSIVPNSMLVKLLSHSQAQPMDHRWMHESLSTGGFSALYWGAWSSLFWLPLARRLAGSFAVVVTQLWFVLHMVAFSVINLGGAYPWYLAAPTIHAVILTTFVVHLLSSAVVVRPGPLRLAWGPAHPPRRMWPVSLAFLAVWGWLRFPLLSVRLRRPSVPHAIAWGTGDLARQSAGAWLRTHTTGTELFATFEGLPAFEYAGPCYDSSHLNSQRDEERRSNAAYQLDGPFPLDEAALPMDEPGTGRKLVATFRYDAVDDFYLLYAKPESEIGSSAARHLLFPTPTLWVDAPGQQPRQPAVRNGNTWILPATALARFEVRSPGPPTVLFTLILTRGRELSAGTGDSVVLSVRSDGVDLHSAVLTTGGTPERVRATAPPRSVTGTYTFEIETRAAGSQESRAQLVEFREVVVRYGDPLEARDFKLSFERGRSRIDYVATTGLPWRLSGW